MRNIKLTIAYDGTRYKGWQKQANTESTIQGKLNEILSSVCGEAIELIGASRTDAGVHAYKQIANFQTKATILLEQLKKSINDKLDNDISIKTLKEAAPRFHARYNAVGKKYLYRVWNREDINVFERKYAYHLAEPLDIAKMKAAAHYLIGIHDFRGFSSDKRTKKSTVKTLHTIEITNNNGMIEMLYHGNSFLYNMVRIISGTLLEIGLGNKPVHAINEILESKDRTQAGFTAPPQGLFLKDVLYGFDEGI